MQAVIEDYLVQGTGGVLGVAGSPTGRLLIDPHHHTLAVQFPAGDRAPNVVELENLEFDVISDGKVVWLENVVHPFTSYLAAGRGVSSHYSDHSLVFENSGRNGHYAPINWTVS